MIQIEYLKYLQLLFISIAVTAIVSFLILLVNRKNRLDKYSRKESIKPVDGGNISVFFDKQRSAVLIPYVADLFGSGKATANITFTSMPYKPDQLGAAIRVALSSCRIAKPASTNELMNKLESHSWKVFTEGKLNLSVYYKDGKGILFNTTVRTPEGAYIFNTRGPELSLPADTDDEAIGAAALELLKRCR